MQTIKAWLKNQLHLFTLGPNSGFCTEFYLAMIRFLGNSKHFSPLSCFCKTSLGLINRLPLMDYRCIFFSWPTWLLLLFQILRNIHRTQIRKDLWRLSTSERIYTNIQCQQREVKTAFHYPLPFGHVGSPLLPHKHQNWNQGARFMSGILKYFLSTYIYN